MEEAMIHDDVGEWSASAPIAEKLVDMIKKEITRAGEHDVFVVAEARLISTIVTMLTKSPWFTDGDLMVYFQTADQANSGMLAGVRGKIFDVGGCIKMPERNRLEAYPYISYHVAAL